MVNLNEGDLKITRCFIDVTTELKVDNLKYLSVVGDLWLSEFFGYNSKWEVLGRFSISLYVRILIEIDQSLKISDCDEYESLFLSEVRELRVLSDETKPCNRCFAVLLYNKENGALHIGYAIPEDYYNMEVFRRLDYNSKENDKINNNEPGLECSIKEIFPDVNDLILLSYGNDLTLRELILHELITSNKYDVYCNVGLDDYDVLFSVVDEKELVKCAGNFNVHEVVKYFERVVDGLNARKISISNKAYNEMCKELSEKLVHSMESRVNILDEDLNRIASELKVGIEEIKNSPWLLFL
ncbi:hypothetical protein ACUYOF_07770 [Photobacterium ganghwense]|uniref:hypothetical protein n=1 Tax=Photobacterium ganghwense TaxID=320778 RepID=UPI0040575BB2